MKGKHTSGPWKVAKQDKVIGYFPIYARIGVTQLACIAKTDSHEVGFGISENEQAANARLIAAAPELLEALRPLAAWAENERRRHNASDEENEAAYMGELADKARAAIKKATGV